MKIFKFAVMVPLVLAGCELATTDTPVTQTEQNFARSLILDNGFRCQRFSSIKSKATVEGWSAVCFAESFGTDETSWSYEITKLRTGWSVLPWKPNSELPARCQEKPELPCAKP